MNAVDTLWKALDDAHWELSEAFKDFPAGDLWKRAHPRLLSVGEIAVHIAYWEAQAFFGEGFESPLISDQGRYYTTSVDQPFELPMEADAAFAELKRIHEACKASFLSENPPLESASPHREGWTWHSILEYQAFHVAYHTGQIYSVLHMLGHETADN